MSDSRTRDVARGHDRSSLEVGGTEDPEVAHGRLLDQAAKDVHARILENHPVSPVTLSRATFVGDVVSTRDDSPCPTASSWRARTWGTDCCC